MEESIKSQEEANAIFTYLVDKVMMVEKCDNAQAQKRVRALFDSGVLDGGSPDNPETQRKIEKFLSTHID